jgi:hypothetical protein
MKNLKIKLTDLFYIVFGFFIAIGIPTILIISCRDEKIIEEKTEVVSNKKTEIANPYSLEDFILEEQSEKIVLLSIIKNIQQDTLRFVLREYLKENPEITATINKTYEKSIDAISKKYHISKPKIASILFSYRYEMLTKDEIEENAIEENETE